MDEEFNLFDGLLCFLRYRIPDSGCWIPDTGYSILDAGVFSLIVESLNCLNPTEIQSNSNIKLFAICSRPGGMFVILNLGFVCLLVLVIWDLFAI